MQQGQAEQGLRLLDDALNKLPDVAEVRYHYAVALYKTGDKEEAWRELEELLKDGKSFEGQEDAKRILGEKS